MKNIGSNIGQTPWILKLLTPTNTFQEDFTAPKKQEYQADLLRYTILDGAILDVAVLFPEKNLVVTQNNWFRVSEFAFYLDQQERAGLFVIGAQLGSISACGSFQAAGVIIRKTSLTVFVLQSLESELHPSGCAAGASGSAGSMRKTFDPWQASRSAVSKLSVGTAIRSFPQLQRLYRRIAKRVTP